MKGYVRAGKIAKMIRDTINVDKHYLSDWVSRICQAPNVNNLVRMKINKRWYYQSEQFLKIANDFFTNEKIEQINKEIAEEKAYRIEQAAIKRKKADEKAIEKAKRKAEKAVEKAKRKAENKRKRLAEYNNEPEKWAPWEKIDKLFIHKTKGVAKTFKRKIRCLRVDGKWLYNLDDAKQVKINSGPMIYKSTVLERGWTEGMIKQYLGKPDKCVPNPHHRSTKAFLYYLWRVKKAEALPEIKEKIDKCLKRRDFLKQEGDEWEPAHV